MWGVSPVTRRKFWFVSPIHMNYTHTHIIMTIRPFMQMLSPQVHGHLRVFVGPAYKCRNLGGLTHGQKFVIWIMIPVKNNSNDEFLAHVCVRKLESRMLITITNSNSSPEVNSSEVSLKLRWEFCVCTQKHPTHLLGGGTYVTFVLVRLCVYIRIRSSSREFTF